MIDLRDRKILPETNAEPFSPKAVRKTFKKGEIIQRKGDINPMLYSVTKGLLRSYVIDESGKEHIYMFAPEGWMISDVVAHVDAAPTALFIDAIEDTEVEILDIHSFKNEISAAPGLALDGSEKLAKRIAVLQKRVIMLMSATAWERYEHFLETYPQIVQRVPQKMIASYLGITPEALSKIRSRQGNKK